MSHSRPLGEDPGDEDVVDPQVVLGVFRKLVKQHLEQCENLKFEDYTKIVRTPVQCDSAGLGPGLG